jgi:zinc transporter, ZIP family
MAEAIGPDRRPEPLDRGHAIAAIRERHPESPAPDPPATSGAPDPDDRTQTLRRRSRWLVALPLVGMVLVVATLLALDPIRSLTDTEPVESLALERAVLGDNRVNLHVRNDGYVDLTIAQVMVNDAYWEHTVGQRDLGRFDGTTVSFDYPWEPEIPLHIAVLVDSGEVIEYEIDNPSLTPDLDRPTIGTLGLVGLLMAPIPIALGLAWLPALRRGPGTWFDAAMAFTLGLLAFLVIESAVEGLESALEAPRVLDGIGLFFAGALVTIAVLRASGTVGQSRRAADATWQRPSADGRARPDAAARDGQRTVERSGIRLAWLVAIGIGLHNLGEGLAVGAAINTAEVALGTALVIGFAAHNLTEGVAIAGPLGGSPTRTRAILLIALVAVAGLPVLPGLWLGGFILPAGWAALAFGVAAGALIEVIWAVTTWLRSRGVTITPLTAGGFAAAVVVLYLTGIVTA